MVVEMAAWKAVPMVAHWVECLVVRSVAKKVAP